jgi:hypothetical protein
MTRPSSWSQAIDIAQAPTQVWYTMRNRQAFQRELLHKGRFAGRS